MDACKKYLPTHPGVLHFSVGTLNPELDRPVNDRDFDVALHIVFDSKAAHDAYQVAPCTSSSSTRTSPTGTSCASSTRMWSRSDGGFTGS